ncbi:site-specific DNA-methyltransferase [Adhaeribacter radiodurans]|uniref:site-specific DNA-methyltransferase (adenine-specific) n=1 Tax=Adhaeribacter radiodurans TaxID=2745197 RepID=A0A7L7LFS0_9BACT|nr:site-specific DNA-methyltransferase [Adhaeribacter radiodurans]QMU31365.1 site-specific DNA-methyltransferase [Adhaeribacter radiodurans]
MNIIDTDIIERMDMASLDLVSNNFKKLAALFPNCVTETAEGKVIDFDLLKQELNYQIVEGTKERYRLEWPGKREAIVTANLPTNKTIRPIHEDSVDFNNTENLYIEGDNLEILKILQESYLGKINIIYIDPPYNTGNDFIYWDNYIQGKEVYKEGSGQKDELNQRLVANPETAGRYHSDWLTMMYPRLKLAYNCLSDDGLLVISIDDNEVFQLGKILDEIFGSTNRLACAPWLSEASGGKEKTGLRTGHEYLLIYFKKSSENISQEERSAGELNLRDSKGAYRKGRELMKWGGTSLREDRPNQFYELPNMEGEMILPYRNDGKAGHWRWGKNNPEILKAFDDKSFFHWELRPFNEGILVNGFRERWVPYEKIRDSKKATGWSTWLDKFGSNADGTRELINLFGSKVFDTPKPFQLVKWIVSLHSNENALIMDFFAGSSATAQAVMHLNAEDSGKRRFILVQLPETTNEKSESFKAGYKNICEIGKERIRRAAKKIKKETGADIDYGFRVYRLDESNMQDVYYKPQEYTQATLDLFTDNVKPDRTADDLLAQVMLDWGLPLSLKIEKVIIADKQVFKVAANSLYACFDKGIDEDFAKAIAQEAPLRIVFRDSGFKDDTAKTNVKQLLKQLSPETEMKVI